MKEKLNFQEKKGNENWFLILKNTVKPAKMKLLIWNYALNGKMSY